MTEVVPNQAYDAWNVKSLLFIPGFFVLRRLCQKGGVARFEKRYDQKNGLPLEIR